MLFPFYSIWKQRPMGGSLSTQTGLPPIYIKTGWGWRRLWLSITTTYDSNVLVFSKFKYHKAGRGVVSHTFNPRIWEIEAGRSGSMVSMTEFQDSQGYIVRSCLSNKTNKNQGWRDCPMVNLRALAALGEGPGSGPSTWYLIQPYITLCDDFMSIWHKLQRLERREPQLRKCPHKITL